MHRQLRNVILDEGHVEYLASAIWVGFMLQKQVHAVDVTLPSGQKQRCEIILQ
tara:strand:+ start:465 stop:623 length:159 start_codon:yes stop_codon:yes gene_type:complete